MADFLAKPQARLHWVTKRLSSSGALSKTIADGSVETAGRRLDDWMTWAAAKTDELDPLVQGAESVFTKLVKS